MAEEQKKCCAPSAEHDGKAAPTVEIRPGPDAGSKRGMISLEGGKFLMGSEGPEIWESDGEGPVREVEVEPFALGRCTVSNDQFRAFVEDTGYVTEAERFGWSVVFYNQVPSSHRKREIFPSLPDQPWWLQVKQATWKKPGGPGSDLKGRGDHPVVHVSWHDASAYAVWAGKRLPTEMEWEFAARGGLVGMRYPWGNELKEGGEHRCNIWQGRFPDEDLGEDGYCGTAPARSFKPNGFGFYNMSGNVWEWMADPWDRSPAGAELSRVIRGGSFLCHDSYCNRYRVSARTHNTPESGTCHMGFRLAMSL